MVDESFIGIQGSGLANVVDGDSYGLQLSGIANVIDGSFTGIQASGFVNVIDGDFTDFGYLPLCYPDIRDFIEVGLRVDKPRVLKDDIFILQRRFLC